MPPDYPIFCSNKDCGFVCKDYEARKDHYLDCSPKTVQLHLKLLADQEVLKAAWQAERLVKIEEQKVVALEVSARESIAVASKARADVNLLRSKV